MTIMNVYRDSMVYGSEKEVKLQVERYKSNPLVDRVMIMVNPGETVKDYMSRYRAGLVFIVANSFDNDLQIGNVWLQKYCPDYIDLKMHEKSELKEIEV